MSKGKKGKGSADIGMNLDEAFMKEAVNDGEWQGSLVFLAPSSPDCELHIKALTASANGGNRKKFHVIDKDWLLQMALDDAKLAGTVPSGGGGKKSKQGSVPPADKTLHVQVCQQVSNCLANKEAVSSSLLAKLLKYAILKKKRSDIKEKEPPQKEVVVSAKHDKSKKRTSSGRASKAVKKGKETPVPELSLNIPIPEKLPTEMKKRGEEYVNSKYINDEPEDGPECYILASGFTSVDFYDELGSLKLSPLAVVKFIDSKSPKGALLDNAFPKIPSECTQESSSTFSADFLSKLVDLINSSESDSTLRDMAILDLNVSHSNIPLVEENLELYGQQLFDCLAMRVYLVLEQYSQYQQYLKFLDVQPLDYGNKEHEGSQCESSNSPFDCNLYHSLLAHIPEEYCSVQLVLHSMVEQVCSRQGEKSSLRNTSDHKRSLQSQVNSILTTLKCNTDDIEVVASTNPHTAVSSSLDNDAKLFNTALSLYKQVEIMAIYKYMTLLSENANYLCPPSSYSMDQQAVIDALCHFSLSNGISISDLQFTLLIMSLECLHLPTASNSPCQVPLHHKLACDEFISDCLNLQSGHMTNSASAAFLLPLRNLENLCVQQLFTKEELLQILQESKLTHPYLYVCRSNCCECNVLIAHPGFDTSGVCSAKVTVCAASKVGFQSYVSNLSEIYGSYAEQLAMIEETELSTEDICRKESLVGNVEIDTKPQNTANDSPSDKCFSTKSHKIAAYDLGGKAVVGRESTDTLFTVDGIQIRSQQYTVVDGNSTVMTSIINKGLAITSNLVWANEACSEACSYSPSELKKELSGERPQIPPKLISASVCASFHNKLVVSASIYGPKGNGDLPYLPAKPMILEEDASPNSISQSQLGTSPQKLSKKQQEQQQTMLEQQRLLEEQHMKKREAAAKQYQAEYKLLSNHNVWQQLFATTNDGLHLHCQVIQQDTKLGGPELETAVLVRQTFVSCKDLHHSQMMHEEKERCYLPDGTVIRYLSNGATHIFGSDGTIFQTASKSQQNLFEDQISAKCVGTVKSVGSSISETAFKLLNSKGTLWLVTTPLGERYLWKAEGKLVYSYDKSVNGLNKDSSIEEQDNTRPKHSVVYLQPLKIFKATDPVSKKVYVSREDGVTILYQPNGSHVVQYADGTRLATTEENKSILMECPTFASVLCNPTSGECIVDLHNGIIIKCKGSGEYSLIEGGHQIFDINANGETKYYNEDGQYSLVHTGLTNTVNARDKNGRVFTVDCNGKGSIDQNKPPSKNLTEVFKPRFFIVDSYGSCTELLDYDSVSDLAKESSQTVCVEEVIPSVGRIVTLFEPYLNSSSNHSNDHDIIPANLKIGQIDDQSHPTHPAPKHVFGTTLGSRLLSSDKRETVVHSEQVKYKQFLYKQPVTLDAKKQISSLLNSCMKWLEITENESFKANDNNQLENPLSNYLDQNKLISKYKQALSCKESHTGSFHNSGPCCASDVNELGLFNINETEELKAILRCQDIPPYSFAGFEQPNEEPDMTILASQLATTPSKSCCTNTMSNDAICDGDDVFSKRKGGVERQTRNTFQTQMTQHQADGELHSLTLCTSPMAGTTTHPTSPMAGTATHPLKHIEVLPSAIDFGNLTVGSTYQAQFSLKNIGLSPCRFSIKQPPPETGIKIQYNPGLIAAGMTRLITIELFANVPSVVECKQGSLDYPLEIRSEVSTAHLPIRGSILSSCSSGTDHDVQPMDTKS